jgi:hypothetical protein
MNDQFLGLLECPLRRGWIEFSYSEGDRVANLMESINKKWGDPPTGIGGEMFFTQGWRIFCKQKNGAYLLLHKNSHIPTSSPANSKLTIPQRATISHTERLLRLYSSEARKIGFLYSEDDDLRSLDLLHYFEKTPRSEDELSIQYEFKRDYELPNENRFNVKLLALVALTGG